MERKAQLRRSLGNAYQIETELGHGGMSRVFLAEERALGRRVVIKLLPPERTAGISMERFLREIRLLANLQHPCIVPLLAAGEVDGQPYYTMPFVAGDSLRARLDRDGRIAPVDALGVLRDVASALAYAHEHGVVHRDIKPENVLLSGDYAVVTDFGVAKALSSARSPDDSGPITSDGHAIGTIGYMAPEQLAADPNVDHRADLYSLGVVAYEMLSGATPFANLPPRSRMAAYLGQMPEPLDTSDTGVPPALAQLVMHCLAKDPGARPRSARELVRRLGRIAALLEARRRSSAFGVAQDAVQQARTATSAYWMRRRRAFAIAGLLIALLLAAALAIVLLRR
ncbi:MAG TPA: serine/threonine-protein kinase [Gemmatimonadaceae bacterium]|nr:serine/threonine-protein kinase [Gemmatimonadaceae bacterium]